ncbi:T9SS type A sorting domain-containing protein [Zobellia laminariae]|uniref:T9SS type A sorting domain-containing protein n=1 Tax=Zobellia laminariae TaxID=248906 RepID=UPI0012D98F84|nr:T9SS C-terminal target domain-containing protein [Zobellia laminariae]
MKRFLYGQLIFIFLFSFCNTLFGQETNYKVEYSVEHYMYDRPDNDTNDDDYSELKISFFTSGKIIYNESLSFGGPDENGRFTVFDDIITTPNPETSLRYFYDTECPENNWQPFTRIGSLSSEGCREGAITTGTSTCSDFVHHYSRIVELPSSSLILPDGNAEFKECEPFTIQVAECDVDLSYALEYTLRNPLGGIITEGELSPYSLKSSSFTFELADFTGLGANDLGTVGITARYVADPNTTIGAHRTSVSLTPTGCSPNQVGLPQTSNETCFLANDGSVTLTFDDDVDTSDSQIRFYVFKGTTSNPSDSDLEQNPPSLPNPPQTILDPRITLVPVGGGSTNFTGTLNGLEGGDETQNSQSYYIVYQEVDYTVDPVVVKSFGYTPSFTIEQPSQIIASGSIEAPQFCGDTAKISFGASGGNDLNSTGSYSYQYRINSTNDADWSNISANPQPVALINIEQTVQIRAQYSVNGCFSEAITLTDYIEAAAPDLTFTMPSPGTATSNVIDDGVISIEFGGGTPSVTPPNYTFELLKENATNGFDILSVLPSDIILTGNRIEYRNLGIGTYRIRIIDANSCELTSGDIEVSAAPVPQFTDPVTTDPTCNNGTDGSVSFDLTNPVYPYQYRILDGNNVLVDSGNDIASPSAPINITSNSLGAGNYTIEVIYNTGSFNPPLGVVSKPFTIVNPVVITATISAVPFSCFDSTDGALTVVAMGATNYEYELNTDRGNWVELVGNTIFVDNPNFYEVTLRNRDNPSCVSAVSNREEVTRPLEIAITENIGSHVDVSTNGVSNGALEILVENGTPSYTFSWTRSETLSSAKIPFTPSALNSTDTNLIDLPFGIYQVTLTDDANNCPSVLGPEIEITQPGPLNITDFIGTDTCNGLETGTITSTVQGTGNITFEFLLQPGEVGESVAYTITTTDRTVTTPNLGAGTYGLRITEVTSTAIRTTDPIDYVTISELPGITAETAKTDVSCDGFTPGTITVSNVIGGSQFISAPNDLTGYEYRINDTFNTFQAEPVFNNVAVGSYTLTVRDALGCEFNTLVEVVQNGVPLLDPIATIANDASSDTSLDGSVVLEFETGTDLGSLSFEWSGPGVSGITTKDLNGVGTGTYQVIITAPGNCTLSEIFTIGVEAAFSIQPLTGTPTLCSGGTNGSVTANITATGPVTFNWKEEDGSVDGILISTIENSALRNLSLNNLSTGIYYLEAIDENNVEIESNRYEIVELPEVSATIVPVPTCSGSNTGSITFIPSGTLTYFYSIDGGTTFQPEPVFENLADITYNLQVRASESPNCDYVQSDVRIGVSPGMYWDENNSSIVRASGPEVNDGSIIAAFTGGTEPYNYSLNNGTPQLTNVFADLSKGTYSVTVTDAAGCSASQDFEVTEIGPLTISNINVTDASCLGEANGSITTTVTGEGDITFLWTLGNDVNGNPIPVPVSNGTDGPNITGILAGNYILTVTDDNATRFTEAIAVGEPTNSVTVTNVALTDVSCFGGNDGTLEVEAGGGTGPYMYSINGGDYETSNLFEDLSAGNYTISVRDANNCTFTEPTPEILLEPQELGLAFIDIKPVTLPNASDGAISITVEGGLGTYTYSWSGPNGYTSVDKDVFNGEAGDYVVTITDAENASCSYTSDPIKITEPGELIVTLFLNETLSCSSDSDAVIIANVQGDQPFTYQWFEVVNTNTIELEETTNIIGDLPAGTYLLKVTDSNNITLDSTIEISAPTPLNINIDNSTNVICAGEATGSINITVTGGTPPYQYFWSNSATVPDISGLDAGEYIIEVQDEAGCIAQETITITPPGDAIQIVDAAIINVTEYQGIDGSISLDITGGSAPYSYAWTRISDNSITGNQRTISNLAADSYLVTVSDVNGCSVTEIYEVTQPDIVVGTIIQPTCSGDSNGSISVLANEGNGTFSYLWNTGATESDINNLAAGTYSVTVTGFDSGPINRTYVLENPAPLEVDLGSDRILCAGQTLELDATVDDETATYSWSSDNGFSSSEPNIELTATGNYTVTVQSETGCIAEGNIFVDISSDEINAEFAVSSQVFTGESIIAVDISYPLPDGIEWILPVQAKIETQNRDEAQFSFAEAGEYEVSIITTRGDCVAQKTKKIVVVARDGLITEEDTKNGKKLIEDFLVYPNPSDGRFTADVTLTEIGDINIRVFSLANNALMASKRDRDAFSYSIPFDLSGLPAGVYAVLLETPYGQTLRKVIIK